VEEWTTGESCAPSGATASAGQESPPGRPVTLAGDGPTGVIRLGDTVHRTTGPWSPAVHRLLDHLRDQGFHAVPRYLGLDEAGREILGYVAGTVPPSPLPDEPAWDGVLTRVGVTLRAFHDATVALAPLVPDGWQFAPVEPVEVICHNDIAPDNVVLRADGTVAFIDLDTAAPGPRAWDLAYALYRFAPLSPDVGSPESQARRARLLLDGYEASPPDRAGAVRLVPRRLETLAAFVRTQAQAGHPAYARHLAEGHADLYRRDAEYARAHVAAWTTYVTR